MRVCSLRPLNAQNHQGSEKPGVHMVLVYNKLNSSLHLQC